MIYILTYDEMSSTAKALRKKTTRFQTIKHDTWELKNFWFHNYTHLEYNAPEVFIVDIISAVNGTFKGNRFAGWNMIALLEDLVKRYPEMKFIFVENRVIEFAADMSDFMRRVSDLPAFKDMRVSFKDSNMLYFSLKQFEEKLQ